MDAAQAIAPAAAVQETFRRVAPRYDFLNHTLCAGMDWYWRWRLMRAVRRHRPARILDLATGTGDVALTLRAHQAFREMLVGVDFCLPMLQVAQRKGLAPLCAVDGLRLSFRDSSFDAVTIAFGLRNLEDWRLGLKEMRRVLRPGGRLYILEFSHPYWWLRAGYFWYLGKILPRVAGFFGADEAAYIYLGDSISAFPHAAPLAELLRESGFTAVTYHRLTGGLVALHEAAVAS
jgi:demethylmenaquinone methyltransferase/2-methoxy-6-polyprenyl-1,4-benzoquinol methylase